MLSAAGRPSHKTPNQIPPQFYAFLAVHLMPPFQTSWYKYLRFLPSHLQIPTILLHSSHITFLSNVSSFFQHHFDNSMILLDDFRPLFRHHPSPTPVFGGQLSSIFYQHPISSFFCKSSFLLTLDSNSTGNFKSLSAFRQHYYHIPRLIPTPMVILDTRLFRPLNPALFPQYPAFLTNPTTKSPINHAHLFRTLQARNYGSNNRNLLSGSINSSPKSNSCNYVFYALFLTHHSPFSAFYSKNRKSSPSHLQQIRWKILDFPAPRSQSSVHLGLLSAPILVLQDGTQTRVYSTVSPILLPKSSATF